MCFLVRVSWPSQQLNLRSLTTKHNQQNTPKCYKHFEVSQPTNMKLNSKSLRLSCKSHNPGIKISTCTLPNFLIRILLLCLCCFLVPASCSRKPPPLPILPLPTTFQLQWQLDGMALFFHFGTNTFTDSEWGTGHANPTVFNPTKLNASQWIRVAKDSGFSRVILTVKHHDGFCLWPSDYTNYTVRSSNWRNGNGDVVAELAAAAKDAGVGLGFYLSPWDRHEACYGDTLQYNEFYLAQMTELLTR